MIQSRQILYILTGLFQFITLLFAAIFFSFSWILTLIITLIIFIIFINPLIIEKSQFLMSFYHGKEKSENTKISIFIKYCILAFIEIIIISLSSLNLSCPAKYDNLYIVYLIFLILSLSIFKYRIFKFHRNYLLAIRNYYFKDSIIIGFLFSITMFLLNSSSIIETGWDMVSQNDICAAFETVNIVIFRTASFLPFPLNIAVKIIINLNIICGYIFSAYVIFADKTAKLIFGVQD